MRKTFSVDFFRRSPRAWEIRTKCIETLEILNELTEDPDLTTDEVALRTRFNKLHTIANELKELGICAGMSTGRPKGEYKSDPVVAMEWTAGQLLDLIDRGLVVAAQVHDPLIEFSETVSDQCLLIDLKAVPDVIGSWTVQRQIVAFFMDMTVMEEKT